MAQDDDDEDDLSEATLDGDVRRERWPDSDAPRVNLYAGNGRFGGCFDAYGLQHNGWHEQKAGIGNTVLMHADHRVERNGVTEFLPLARWVWANDLPSRGEAAPSYEQTLRLNQGWLYTSMNWGGLDLAIVAFFHPVQRDICVLSIDYECSGSKSVPPLMLAPAQSFTAVYCEEKKGRARLDVQAEGAQTALQLRVVSEDGKARVEAVPEGLRVSFGGKVGQHVLLLSAGAVARADELTAALEGISSVPEFMRDGVAAWQKPWAAACVELPDATQQALYERSLYYLLSSYENAAGLAAPASGWSGNGALTPNERARSCAAATYQLYGLPEWKESDASYAVTARSVDEFLAVTRTDAEHIQFQDDVGDAPFSLMAHAIFLNTVHATLLNGFNGSQSMAWPIAWDSAAFENFCTGDGPASSARYENGEWSALT
jgi:hypothetical protein